MRQSPSQSPSPAPAPRLQPQAQGWLPPAEPRLLDVPDPRRAVLDDVVTRLTSVAITLNALA